MSYVWSFRISFSKPVVVVGLWDVGWLYYLKQKARFVITLTGRRLSLTSEQCSSLLEVILIFCSLKLKFGPVIPTPPYSEGELYTVLERNVSIQVRPE